MSFAARTPSRIVTLTGSDLFADEKDEGRGEERDLSERRARTGTLERDTGYGLVGV